MHLKKAEISCIDTITEYKLLNKLVTTHTEKKNYYEQLSTTILLCSF